MTGTFVSLFSGVGGLDIAAEALGMTPVAHVEAAPYCREVLDIRWPGLPVHDDVRTVDWSAYRGVDALVGGFPCQPVSQAGRRLVAEDPRWLWPAFADAIKAAQPRLALAENVRGLVKHLNLVTDDLTALGYGVRWGLLRASDVGAPHRRERVFLAASRDWGGVVRVGLRTGSGDVTLLPTPTVGNITGGNLTRSGARNGELLLPGVVAVLAGRGDLLPTPTSRDTKGADLPSRRGGAGLPTALDRLLPTPTPSARDGMGGPGTSPKREGGMNLRTAVAQGVGTVDWQKYGNAVRRWEALTRPAPVPWEEGRNRRPRVTADFVEWMMGLPEGWTHGERRHRITALGNAVVPQQAAAAYRTLLV